VVVSLAVWLIRVGLSAIRAAVASVGDNSLLAIVVYVANEYPTVSAGVGAQALKAGVVRLHSVVVILSGWVRVGCARLFGVHSGVLSLWAGLRGVSPPAGPFLYPTPSLYRLCTIYANTLY
jgi:hypothetical protein